MKFKKTNIEIRINIFEILCVYVQVCQISGKTNSFDFFSPSLPKNGFRVGNLENYCWNENQHPQYTTSANFLSKWTTLNFSAQIFSKNDLGLETEKSNVGIRINIVETLCVPIFCQPGQLLSFSLQVCPKMDLGFEIQKTNIGTRISNLEITCVPIFRQKEQLWYFWPKFAQKWI